MNEELLKNLSSLGVSRSALKKIPSQQLDRMIRQYSVESTSVETNLTDRQKLRKMIREKENARLNIQAKQKVSATTTPTVVEPQLSEKERQIRHKNRMRRFKDKYGQVSESDYYDALSRTQNVGKLSTQEREALQKYFNMVDLYNHQHRQNEVEKEINLDEF